VRTCGAIRARFEAQGGATRLARAYETGGWRLRHPHSAQGCEAVIVNTGGGIVGGDHIALAFETGPASDLTLTTPAAEKIYRSESEAARIDVTLGLEAGARLAWLPQETILFDHAKLTRRLSVDLAADASLCIVEMLVFGRLAKGETEICGAFRDSWRVRRAGKLVFAEEARLEGAFAPCLAQQAIGAGARATALVLCVAPDAESKCETMREALAPFEGVLDCGASAWNGMLVLRLLSVSPEPLRAAILKAHVMLSGRAMPRVW